MNGFAPSDLQGNYKRPKGITIDNEYDINNESGQIYLLVGHSCPWCQRTLLVHEIKDLSKKVEVIFLKADIEHGEWIFNTKIKGCKRLSDLYTKANEKIIFRATLPLLISFVKDEVNILSNESSQIIRLLNSIKSESKYQALSIKNGNQKFLDLINNSINDGVYKCMTGESCQEDGDCETNNCDPKTDRCVPKKVCSKFKYSTSISSFPIISFNRFNASD